MKDVIYRDTLNKLQILEEQYAPEGQDFDPGELLQKQKFERLAPHFSKIQTPTLLLDIWLKVPV